MSALSIVLALSPLALIVVLLLWKRVAADVAGTIGLVLTVFLALAYFDTSFDVVCRALLAGTVGSLPVGLVIAASIFQISVMAEMGALARVTAFIKTLTPGNKAVQALCVNVGFGILLTGLGAATMAILPPLLLALGYSVSAAILLSCLGYVGLCMYALLGIPAVILATFTGQSLYDIGMALAAFMPLVSTGVAFACLHVAGGFTLMRQGFWPAMITGLVSGGVALLLARAGLLTLTAIIAGFAIMAALLIYVKLTGGRVRDAHLGQAPQEGFRMSLARACSPWILLVVVSCVMNSPLLPFFDMVFKQWSMPLPIIPNAPERLRLFWQAYFWVFVCTIACLPLLKVTRTRFASAWKKSCARAWRPLLATIVYFCIAYVMNHSGKQADWTLPTPNNNMILLLAHSAANALGTGYAVAVPFLGLLAGFVSGSASSAVAMLTKLQLAAAESIGASGITLATASGVGGGLASAMSPSKLLSAGASIDKPGAANSVMGYAFVLTLIVTVLCAVLTYIWAF